MGNNKEFNRAACFTFFESYLEQAKQIKEQFGAEAAANYLIGIADYALYAEEPTDPLAKVFVSGLKNAIDAGQEKRARGFNQENTMQTEAIKKYKLAHPSASYREIAAAVGCGKSKVGKVLGVNSEDCGIRNFAIEMQRRKDGKGNA